MPSLAEHSLDNFHPLLREWFNTTYSRPTAVQERSWPSICDRRHLLITAPTGSGKTMTAFFALLDRLAKGEAPTGRTSFLYVSPLKALNNDIQRNLLEPLGQIRRLFAKHGERFPEISVLTRSGDTPQRERQRMLRHPPEILVTTPESLLLMLSAARSRRMLNAIECVIVDEVHALVDNRRGASLMAALEWLANLCGEFQRIALSATISPLKVVSNYVAGTALDGQPRRMEIVDDQSEKKIELKVCMPEQAPTAAKDGQPIWDYLVDDFREIIESNTSTLLFSESRRMAERIALNVNEKFEQPVVYSHHGSLARELRLAVESRLKKGELRGLVSTSSLEMGIDVGALDEVVLVQSPPSIASTRQRIGRAGHNVGETSKARLYPTHARDLIEAAVLTSAVQRGDLEPLRPMYGALDLLAQLIVAMVISEDWPVNSLYETIIRSSPYADLKRSEFELVLDMLTGKYEGLRIRSLRPRVALDRKAKTVAARKGAAMAFYGVGGTIPDRGYFRLRSVNEGTLIGELDEEFVWEAKVGQAFTFGTQSWVIEQITHQDVLARPAGSRGSAPPFWRSEISNRDFHYADLIGKFLRTADEQLEEDADGLKASLQDRGFDQTSSTELIDFLTQQKEATGALPHSGLVVAEQTIAGPSGYTAEPQEGQLILHTPWGGRVNRPIALALEAEWQKRYETDLDVYADNNVIVLQLMQGVSGSEIVEFVMDMDLRPRLRESLENSGFFGRIFRECAGRALLITKTRFDQRVPLWMTRMQSKKLLDAAQAESDFPLLLETWRTCLNDEFDMPAAESCLAALREGTIEVKVVVTRTPSPFARDVTHDQVSRYMYADDSPTTRIASNLSDELIARAVVDSSLRPEISLEVIAEFESKTQRRAPGYEPSGDLELSEWVKERVWIPKSEWFDEVEVPSVVREVQVGDWRGYVHDEIWSDRAEWGGLELSNALQFYGPRTRAELIAMFPLPSGTVDAAIDGLLYDDTLVGDVKIADEVETRLCDSENLETLLRFQRRFNRPQVDPISGRDLTGFWIRWLDLEDADSVLLREAMLDSLSDLRCYSAPLNFWFHDLWRTRYDVDPGRELDSLFADQELLWWGTGSGRISIGFSDDAHHAPTDRTEESTVESAFTDPSGRYTFRQLADRSGERVQSFNDAFWDAVWRAEISSDNIAALRRGILQNFEFDVSRSKSTPSRIRTRIKRSVEGWPGNWYRLEHDADATDPMLELEDQKERVRILLARYGLLTREIANREGGLFRWAALFNALRVMELSGEVLAGLFVKDMSGPQFAHRDVLPKFDEVGDDRAIWISAMDSISPCGLGLKWPALPQRREGNHMGFHGKELICTSTNFGRRLFVHTSPEDERILQLFQKFPTLFHDKHAVTLEEINGCPARQSEYLPVLTRVANTWHDHSRVYVEASN